MYPSVSPAFNNSPYYTHPGAMGPPMYSPLGGRYPMYNTGFSPLNNPGMQQQQGMTPQNGGLWQYLSSAGTFTSVLARVSMNLDANWNALNMSFMSMARLFDGIRKYHKEIISLLRAKLGHSIYEQWMKGRTLTNGNLTEQFRLAERRKRYTPIIAVLGVLAWFFGPSLLYFIAERLLGADRMRLLLDDVDDNADSQLAAGEGDDVSAIAPVKNARELVDFVCQASYDYVARHHDELSLRRGDKVLVLRDSDAQLMESGWLSCEREDGVRGLAPFTHLVPLKRVDTLADAASTSQTKLAPNYIVE